MSPSTGRKASKEVAVPQRSSRRRLPLAHRRGHRPAAMHRENVCTRAMNAPITQSVAGTAIGTIPACTKVKSVHAILVEINIVRCMTWRYTSDVYTITLSICVRSAHWSSILCRHKQATHSDSAKYTCTQCWKNFHEKDHCYGHMNSHIGITPYTCTCVLQEVLQI